MFVAVAISAACLAVILLLLRLQRANRIIEEFASHDVYNAIVEADSVALSDVQRVAGEPTVGVPEDFAKDFRTVNRKTLSPAKAERVQEQIAALGNYVEVVAKDYLWRPELCLAFEGKDKTVLLFVDPKAQVGVLTSGDQFIAVLMMDAYMNELQQILK